MKTNTDIEKININKIKYIDINEIDNLLDTLEKYILLSDKKKVFYCINLFYNSYPKNFELINRLIEIYIKYIKNYNIFIYFNTLLVKLYNMHENINENNLYNEKKYIYKIINLLCDSTKCLDNLYYKFCLYSFHNLEEKNKDKLKNEFIFFEDIYYTEFISYIPTKMPEYIINLNEDLVLLSKNFVGSLEQKNDICIYYAHCLYNYNKEMPKYFDSFKKPIDLLFDLIKFVFVNYNSKYLYIFDILLSWYNITHLDLCWQTLLLYEIESENTYDDVHNEDSLYESYNDDSHDYNNFICLKLEDDNCLKHLNFKKFLRKEKSNNNYKNAFISYNPNCNFFKNSYLIYNWDEYNKDHQKDKKDKKDKIDIEKTKIINHE